MVEWPEDSAPVDTFLAVEPTEREPSRYADLVESAAILLHSFDPQAKELGISWAQEEETSRGRDIQNAYRFMAETVLDGIGPMIERRVERDRTNGKSTGIGRLWRPRNTIGRHASR